MVSICVANVTAEGGVNADCACIVLCLRGDVVRLPILERSLAGSIITYVLYLHTYNG